jgi:hypothetical protein
MTTTFEVHGSLIGELWWPYGASASKRVDFTFSRTGGPFTAQAETLRDAIEGLVRAQDGDFSTAARIDGVLVVVRRTTTRETRRFFDLAFFASIEDYVARPEELLA